MDRSEILEFAKERGYDDIKEMDIRYKDFDVYEPFFSFDEVAYIGLPLRILVRGDTIRMTTPEEAEQIQRAYAIKLGYTEYQLNTNNYKDSPAVPKRILILRYKVVF